MLKQRRRERFTMSTDIGEGLPVCDQPEREPNAEREAAPGSSTVNERELQVQLAAARADAAQARAALQALETAATTLQVPELAFDLDAIQAAARGQGRYKSCNWIEEGVFLENRTVNLCCMQSVGNLSSKLYDTDGSIPDFDRLARAKAMVRVGNQTNNPPCGNCYLLKEAEWEAKDYLGFVGVGGFLHCNLSCSYCVTYNFDPRDRGGDALQLVQTYLEQGVLRPGKSRLEWGGGESTFHKDFDAIARLAAEKQIWMAVYTNATSYCEALEPGLRSGTNSVIISIDAGTDDTYDRIKGKRFLEKVWTNVGRYVAVNPDCVIVKYIVMEANSGAEDLDAFISRAQTLGVKRLAVSVDVHNNTASQGRLSTNVLHATAYLLQRARGRGLHSWLADMLSPESQQAVEALSAELADQPETPLQLRQNAPRPLEIAYTDGPIFARRVAVALKNGDDFEVICPQPINPELAHSNVLALISAWVAGGLGPEPADSRSKRLVERALATVSQPLLSEQLRRMRNYRLDLRFNEAGLVGISAQNGGGELSGADRPASLVAA